MNKKKITNTTTRTEISTSVGERGESELKLFRSDSDEKMIKELLGKILASDKAIGVIFAFNLVILFLYLFKASFVQIDNTTILLMVLVLITPFASHIKKIKWGDFEADLSRDIEKLKQRAEEIGEPKTAPEDAVRLETLPNELYELASKDSVLALAKLRIEIEIRLNRLFTESEKESVRGIRNMTQKLAAAGTISNKLRILVLDIISILNRAVHGVDIPTEAKVNNVIAVGIEILDELDHVFYNELIGPSSKKVISKRELNKYMKAKYEVVSAVPLVKNPYISKRTLNQEQLDQFLDGYDEYAEFIVEIKKL